MADAIRLYFRYIGISVKSQMQYRASFVMLVIGHFFATGVDFIAIWALFDRFKTLEGWSLEEVALFYGLVHVAFAIAEGAGRGFDIFPGMVRSGDFDRILLRPRGTIFQVAAQELQLMRLGRLLQGLIVLLWATSALDVVWTMPKIALMLFTITGGVCLFTGLFVIQATWGFWTIESLELMNTMTYGGTETAQYPLSIYREWFRRFFTFIVPLACISYFPAHALLGREDATVGSPLWFQYSAPAIGIIFLIIALQFWRFGVRHYKSTGS